MGGPPGWGQPPGGNPYGPPGGYAPPPGGFGPPGGPPNMVPGGGPSLNPLAIASLVLGILSIPGCCCWFASGPMAVAALVLGIVAMNKIRSSPLAWKGGGMAIAGIVCASVGLLLSIVAIFSTLDDQLRGRWGVHL